MRIAQGMSMVAAMTAIVLLGRGESLAQGKGPSATAPRQAKAQVARPKPPPLKNAKEIETQLKSHDAATLLTGLSALREAGRSAVVLVVPVESLLRDGLPTELAKTAIDVLGSAGAPSSSAVLAPYLHHRDVGVRKAATRALGRTGGPDAIRALRRGLSDADAGVRGSAASGLGGLAARDAIDDLFAALDHKIPEAAGAIGQLCDASACEKFASRLGAIGFDVMTLGFDQILFRDGAEISDDAKVRLIGRVREQGSAEANKFLKDVQTRWPSTWSARVKQSLDQAVNATEGAAGAKQVEP